MTAEAQNRTDMEAEPARVSTGSAGLVRIRGGGLDPSRLYLYEGRPGTGKTTIALQFLLDGVKKGERVLYITLSETERELTLVANSRAKPQNAASKRFGSRGERLKGSEAARE